jgi:hypothetical protein
MFAVNHDATALLVKRRFPAVPRSCSLLPLEERPLAVNPPAIA